MGLCMSSAGVFVSPDVIVQNASVESIGLSGVKLNVILLIHNPNLASLPVTRIVYLLQKASDNTTLADGISRQNVALKSNGDTRITVPMEFKVRRRLY